MVTSDPKTNSQKILGLQQLMKWASSTYDMWGNWAHGPIIQTCHARVLPIIHHFPVKDPNGASKAAHYLPAFCRPCPTTPQHGFVESRVIRTHKQLEALCQETLEAEEDASIMLTQIFNGVEFNSIWTPTSLTVGPGNDGATSGKGAITLPLAGRSIFTPEMLTAAGIDPLTQSPYVEAIAIGRSVYLTQLRAGPPIDAASPDYIPSELLVQRVIQPNGEDLLEWQQRVKTLESGDVVYHPGGSIADHYSVHCRMSGIPICISFEPKVGDTLAPQPAPPIDVEAFIKGALTADFVSLGTDNTGRPASALALLLVALHNAAVMTGPASFWLGAAITLMCRLGSVALRGESRHEPRARYQEPGDKRKLGSTVACKQRGQIWGRHFDDSMSYHRAGLSRLLTVFRWGQWGINGDAGTNPMVQCGAGGIKWAQCAEGLRPLFNGLRRVMLEGTQEAVNECVVAFNVAVHQVHNGGWWLNKFGPRESLDEIQKGNPFAIVVAMEAIGHLKEVTNTISPDQLARRRAKWAAWPITEHHPPKPRRVSVAPMPEGDYVVTICTGMGEITRRCARTSGEIFVVQTPEKHLRIEARNHDQPPTILYEDAPLDMATKLT